jgi:hypothetical protein
MERGNLWGSCSLRDWSDFDFSFADQKLRVAEGVGIARRELNLKGVRSIGERIVIWEKSETVRNNRHRLRGRKCALPLLFLVEEHSTVALFGINEPKGDRVSGLIRGKDLAGGEGITDEGKGKKREGGDLMEAPHVGPEHNEAIEKRRDRCVTTPRKRWRRVIDPELSAIAWAPVFVEIEDAGHPASISRGVVTMFIVMRAIARVAGDHCPRPSGNIFEFTEGGSNRRGALLAIGWVTQLTDESVLGISDENWEQANHFL